MQPASHPRLFGTLYILFAVLIWVGWTVSSSYSVRSGLTAYDLTALRFGTAAVFMLPSLFKYGLRIGPWGRWGALWLAATMGATYSAITITGMQYAPTSHASGIIINTMLVLTTLGAVFFLHEGTTKLRVFGIAVSLTGIGCLLYAKGADGTDHPQMWIGHGLFLLGGAIWALHALTIKAWRADPIHVTAVVCVVSAVIYLPVYWLFLPSSMGMHNWQQAALQAGYQGILNSIFAGLCFNRAIRLLGASTTSAFLPLIPVLSTLAAVPILKEVPSALEWSGLALAGAGVVLATGLLERWVRQKAHLPAT